MYLACADKEIIERKNAVYNKNEKIIDDYFKLPFYKKFFAKDPAGEVFSSWHTFNEWMNKRIVYEQQNDRTKI